MSPSSGMPMIIRERINQIGEQLVGDAFDYADIVCKPEDGIIARGLIYLEDGRDGRNVAPGGRASIITPF